MFRCQVNIAWVSGIFGHQNDLSINTEFMLLQEYKLLFEGAGSNPGDKTLEDRFFEHEVSMSLECHYIEFYLMLANVSFWKFVGYVFAGEAQ